MKSQATSVAEYLRELHPPRRAEIAAVRQVILDNLDADLEEGMQYGMIAYYVPHRVFPAGYHCDPKQPVTVAALAAQKNYLSLYLMAIYGSQELRSWFEAEAKKAGKKLDMGQSCLRFKAADDLPLTTVGQAIRRVTAKKYIAIYQAALEKRAPRAAAKAAKPAGESMKSARKRASRPSAPRKNAKR